MKKIFFLLFTICLVFFSFAHSAFANVTAMDQAVCENVYTDATCRADIKGFGGSPCKDDEQSITSCTKVFSTLEKAGLVVSLGPIFGATVINETYTCCQKKDAFNNDKNTKAKGFSAPGEPPKGFGINKTTVKVSDYAWTPPPVKLKWSFYGQFLSKDVQNRCLGYGDCTLNDILIVGAAFANFLMALSAGLLFVSFVYGGAMYLLSFGEASKVEKGKSAIKISITGMLIVMCSWAIVNYVINSLGVQIK